jgi:hypothetical protein
MITLKLNANNEDDWYIYETVVMRQIPHTEEWQCISEEEAIITVSLSEDDYKFWFVEEEEEEEEEA